MSAISKAKKSADDARDAAAQVREVLDKIRSALSHHAHDTSLLVRLEGELVAPANDVIRMKTYTETAAKFAGHLKELSEKVGERIQLHEDTPASQRTLNVAFVARTKRNASQIKAVLCQAEDTLDYLHQQALSSYAEVVLEKGARVIEERKEERKEEQNRQGKNQS